MLTKILRCFTALLTAEVGVSDQFLDSSLYEAILPSHLSHLITSFTAFDGRGCLTSVLIMVSKINVSIRKYNNIPIMHAKDVDDAMIFIHF